jgi:hypothetical protein
MRRGARKRLQKVLSAYIGSPSRRRNSAGEGSWNRNPRRLSLLSYIYVVIIMYNMADLESDTMIKRVRNVTYKRDRTILREN